jgi:hypothetical protein
MISAAMSAAVHTNKFDFDFYVQKNGKVFWEWRRRAAGNANMMFFAGLKSNLEPKRDRYREKTQSKVKSYISRWLGEGSLLVFWVFIMTAKSLRPLRMIHINSIELASNDICILAYNTWHTSTLGIMLAPNGLPSSAVFGTQYSIGPPYWILSIEDIEKSIECISYWLATNHYSTVVPLTI